VQEPLDHALEVRRHRALGQVARVDQPVEELAARGHLHEDPRGGAHLVRLRVGVRVRERKLQAEPHLRRLVVWDLLEVPEADDRRVVAHPAHELHLLFELCLRHGGHLLRSALHGRILGDVLRPEHLAKASLAEYPREVNIEMRDAHDGRHLCVVEAAAAVVIAVAAAVAQGLRQRTPPSRSALAKDRAETGEAKADF
jgi:hypothetical protein